MGAWGPWSAQSAASASLEAGLTEAVTIQSAGLEGLSAAQIAAGENVASVAASTEAASLAGTGALKTAAVTAAPPVSPVTATTTALQNTTGPAAATLESVTTVPPATELAATTGPPTGAGLTPLEASGLSADSGWLQAELAASQASTSGGFLGGIGGKIAGAGRWMQAHPIPSLMGMGFLQGAFSPDQEDLLERQEELRRERYGSLASVGNVNIGFKPPNRPGVLRSKATGAPVYKGGGILSRLRERSSIYSGGTQNA